MQCHKWRTHRKIKQDLLFWLSDFWYIWQLTRNCSMFDRNIQLFEILSNSDFMWFSVRHWWVSVILHWISVKHWLLPWQFAVLSMSVVMFDRTVCVFDRISFRFDRTAQKCQKHKISPKTPSSNQNFEKSPWQNSRNAI